jgi:hypothetical protein
MQELLNKEFYSIRKKVEIEIKQEIENVTW